MDIRDFSSISTKRGAVDLESHGSVILSGLSNRMNFASSAHHDPESSGRAVAVDCRIRKTQQVTSTQYFTTTCRDLHFSMSYTSRRYDEDADERKPEFFVNRLERTHLLPQWQRGSGCSLVLASAMISCLGCSCLAGGLCTS